MNPKALVFGCTGQDGSYLCKSLIEKGFKVFGTSRKSNPDLSRLKALDILGRLDVISCDIEDPGQTLKTIKSVNPKEIYNLSAQSSVGTSFLKPAETNNSIVKTTLNILEACRKITFEGNLFFAGSSEIYGSSSTPSELDSKIDLRSPYSAAKYQSFLLSKMYREIYKINSVTGILFNHESSLRDEKFVIKKIINKAIAIKKGSKEKIILGNINIIRDWGYAKEYMEAIQLINRSKLNKDYIICTGKSYSLRTVIEIVFMELELDWNDHIIISEDLYRLNEIEISQGNPNSLYQDLGWKSETKINQLVQKLINNEV